MADKELDKEGNISDEEADFGLPKVELTSIQAYRDKVSGKQAHESKPKIPVVIIPDKEEKSATQPTEAVIPVVNTKDTKIPEEQGKRSNRYWIFVLLLLLLGAGGYFAWDYYEKDKLFQQEEIAPVAETEEPRIEEPEPPVEEPVVEETETEPEEYILTEISSRADFPRYFIIVGSFIDEDLAKDYSDRLIEKMEKNTYIVRPDGNSAFYRLAIGQYDNLADATAEINRIQTDFEETLWVLKY